MKYFIVIFLLISLSMKVMASDIQERQIITVANVHQLVEIAEWKATSKSVTQLSFNPNDASLALIQNDQPLAYGRVTFLNSSTLEPIKMPKALPSALSITFSPDGTLFVEVDDSGHLNIYKTQDYELDSQIKVGSEPILNLAIDPNNQYVAVAIGAPEIVTSGKYAFQLFEIETGKVIQSLERKTADIDEISLRVRYLTIKRKMYFSQPLME